VLRLTKPYLDSAEAYAVREVLSSGWIAEGKLTRRFEEELADYVDAKYAIATCNCTIALELSLRALGIRGNVATSAFGHPATPRAIINAGCAPVFVDVDLQSYNINMSLLKDPTVTHKEYSTIEYYQLKAVMPVSWGGNPLIPHDINLPIIEDAACSIGAQNNGHPDVRCFSFHPRKLLTTGEGGMVVTDNWEVAGEVRQLKNFGMGNYKFDDVRAAIGLEQLKKLPTIIRRRSYMAEVYNDLLADVCGVKSPMKQSVYQTYAVYLEKGDRDAIIKKLGSQGIETQIGAYALPSLPQFKHCLWIKSRRNAELLGRNLLALPMSHDMTDEDQKRVVEALKRELA